MNDGTNGEDPQPGSPELPAAPVAPPASDAQGAPTSGPQAAGGLLVLGGGLLVVLSAFLPWITASSAFGGSVSVNGLDAGGWGFVILGGFAAARGASMRWPQTVTLRLGTPLVGGALLAGLLVLRWGDIQKVLQEARSLPGVTASLGIGLVCVVVGIVAILIGGLAGRRA
jgi:uncharacterized membrane protein YidH (DUF202 family)